MIAFARDNAYVRGEIDVVDRVSGVVAVLVSVLDGLVMHLGDVVAVLATYLEILTRHDSRKPFVANFVRLE